MYCRNGTACCTKSELSWGVVHLTYNYKYKSITISLRTIKGARMSTRRIGLDVGGVIIDALGNDNTDTAFRSDNFMRTTAVKGVHKAVKVLIETFGQENVFIISKCGEVIEGKTRLWLEGTGFHRRTGFDSANLFFCRKRPEKAPIAAELRLTDFVDDHADVLGYMKGIVTRRYLFGPQLDQAQDTTGLTVVNSWAETLESVLHPR